MGFLVGVPKNESIVFCPEDLAVALADNFLVLAVVLDPDLIRLALLIGLGILSDLAVHRAGGVVEVVGMGIIVETSFCTENDGIPENEGTVDGVVAKKALFLGAPLSSSPPCEIAVLLLPSAITPDPDPDLAATDPELDCKAVAGFLKNAESFCCFPENSSKNLAAKG